MKEIRLTKAKVLELNPDKAYLVMAKRGAVTEEQAKDLAVSLNDMGISNVLVALADKNAYKIVELPVAAKQVLKKAAEKAKVTAKKMTKAAK